MSSSETFYWHDYETSGADVARDRPLQFAGIRTDREFNIIGEPLVQYCRPASDCLPEPIAVRITGISPFRALREGLCERDFMALIHAELSKPGTCALGYNSLRFDDEITRYALYRNFFPPYAREWGEGRSRWDLIDVTRAVYALRPDGVQWPTKEGGVPSFKLEDLSAANAIDHGNAHDALSDVLATIGLARCLREAQPALFDTLFAQRGKRAIAGLLDPADPKPMVHVSGQFGAARSNLAIVLPLAMHPVNGNEVICADLSVVPDFLGLPVEEVRDLLFTPTAQLPEGARRPPIKTVKLNRSPVVLPLTWVAGEPAERLALNGDTTRAARDAYTRARQADPEGFTRFFQGLFAGREFEPRSNPDLQLYDGFIKRGDEGQFPAVRVATAEELANHSWSFEDKRLPELLFRYRARNFPDSLSAAERAQWQEHCEAFLLEQTHGGWQVFHKALAQEQSLPELSSNQQEALADLGRYAGQLRKCPGLVPGP